MRTSFITGFITRLLIVFAMASLVACKSGDSDESIKSPDLPAGELQSIDVVCTPGILSIGQTGQCTAEGTFREVKETSPDFFQVIISKRFITNRVAWRSQDSGIVEVDKVGKTKGISPGSVKITASLDGVSGSDDVTVPAAALVSITVNCQPKTIIVGNSSQCTAAGTFSDNNSPPFSRDITTQVSWTSSNNARAEINQNGVATGKTAGQADMIATSNGLSGQDTITVRDLMVISLDVKPDSANLPPLCAQQFTATATFEDNSTADVTSSPSIVWTSTSPDTTVNNTGLVNAGPQGTQQANIDAAFTDTSGNTVSDTSTVDVQNTAVAQVCVEALVNHDPASANCVVDPALKRAVSVTVPFRAKVIYANGSVCATPATNPVWSSTVPAVASVDQTGLASTLADGVTDIVAEFPFGQGSHPLQVGEDVLLGYEVLPDFACVGFYTETADNPQSQPPANPGSEQMLAEGNFQVAGPTCNFADPSTCNGALNASTTWRAEEGFWNGNSCGTVLPSTGSPPPATVDAAGVVTPTGQVRVGTACVVGTHVPTGMEDAGTIITFPFADDSQRQEVGEICDQFEPLFQGGGSGGGAGALTQLISAIGQVVSPVIVATPAP